jgi:glycosyltransferase involved in cell wall biosynthesis/cell division septum initiation protein DivIVA
MNKGDRGQLEQLMDRLRELQDAIEQAVAESLALEAENRELEEKLQRLKQRVARLRKKHDSIVVLRQRYRDKANQIKHSHSWRYTAWLRYASRHLKRIVSSKEGTKKTQSGDFSIRKPAQKHSESQAIKLVNGLRRMIYLGFTETALSELQKKANDTADKHARKFAARELALWHANEGTTEGARKALDYLIVSLRDEADPSILRKSAMLMAECLHVLGRTHESKTKLKSYIDANGPSPELYMAMANLEESPEEKIKWINTSLQHYNISPIGLKHMDTNVPFDRLHSEPKESIDSPVKISVIMPVYNAENTIRYSLECILNQSWRNLEVIVVDDHSSDRTVDFVKEYEQRDHRVKLITTEVNGGPYIARNTGLKIATGELVTCHDADDWSHPDKLRIQAEYLIHHPFVVAVTSEMSRVTETLNFHRKGKFGQYVFTNLSSLMFRRTAAMETIGYWDSVRFGADSEFRQRLLHVFGKDAVLDLKTGPLSFARQTENSLTGNEVYGYHGFIMGARSEYIEAFRYYHEKLGDLYYEFPQKKRPFPVPHLMLPDKRSDQPRHFDVILVSDFRLPGGTTMSNLEEIKVQKRLGLRTGLVQMSRYGDKARYMNPVIRDLVDGDLVQVLVYGEEVTCDTLIVRHPPVLQERQRYIPKIHAKRVCVIINQTPKKEYSGSGETVYHIERCADYLEELFGSRGEWFAISPLIRDTLLEHHADELKSIKLAEQFWYNIIDVNEWKRKARPVGQGKIRIGRHSRDQDIKWPVTKEELLTIYPDSEAYEVRILGGAITPKRTLGYLPSNWKVWEFGELDPREFLKELDVFVYYTHPDLVEAFGRVLFEAMAAGVPVVTSPKFKNLFGDAALYAEPGDVQKTIQRLMQDPALYDAQVKTALEFVEKTFGYSMHAKRIGAFPAVVTAS